MTNKAKAKAHRLRLKSLEFISAVGQPAQETARFVLVKSAGDELRATARIVKTEEALGLVFGWAFTPTYQGEDYVDLHGDVIAEDEIVKVAAEFMQGARLSDLEHDEADHGRVVFAMPMTSEIAKAFGVESDTSGLMVAVKPSPDVFAKCVAGELTGFSIGGTGVREPLDKGGPTAKVYISYDLGDRVRVLNGKAHMAHASNRGTVVEREAGVCAVLFDGETEPHRWYAPSEIAPLDPDEAAEPVAMRAPAVKADKAAPDPTPTTTTTTAAQEPTMDPKKLIKAFAAMTDEQVAHLRGLDEEGRLAFLEKSDAERVAIVKAAHEADPEVFKTADGRVIRKSMDPHGILVPALKAAEAAEAAAAAAVKKAARVELEKRTEKLTKHLPGTLEARCALVEAAEGIADPELRKGAVSAIAAADAAASPAFKMTGFAGGTDEDATDPVEQMTKMAQERAKATGETVDAARAHLLQTNDRYLTLHKRAKAARA